MFMRLQGHFWKSFFVFFSVLLIFYYSIFPVVCDGQESRTTDGTGVPEGRVVDFGSEIVVTDSFDTPGASMGRFYSSYYKDIFTTVQGQ